MKLTSKPLAAAIFVILFGGIIFTTWMGWWQTETTREPAKYNEGELAGQYNPADIRGSYTFGDVSNLFEIPMSDLQTAFHLPPGSDPAAVALKDLESIYSELPVEIGTASVRMFTAYYKGLPYEPSEETYLFAEAIDILKQQGHLTPQQTEYLEQHIAYDAASAAGAPRSRPEHNAPCHSGSRTTSRSGKHATGNRAFARRAKSRRKNHFPECTGLGRVKRNH